MLGGIAGVVGAGILTAFVFFKVAEYRAEQEEAGHWQRAGVDRASATLAHQKPITAMAFSPDGRILATADEGGAYTWDAKTWGKLSVAWRVPSRIKTLVFSPDSSRLVAIDEHSAARILDPATGGISRAIEGVQAAVFSADSARLTTLGTTVRVWDATTGGLVKTVAVPFRAVSGAEPYAFSSDGGRFVAQTPDGTFKLIATGTGAELSSFRVASCDYSVRSVAISADNSKVLAAGQNGGFARDGCVSIMDSGGHEVRAFRLPEVVDGAAFSPDGSRVATASEDGKTRVFDIASGQVVYVLQDNRADTVWNKAAKALTFSPDGSRLAVAGEDKSIRVWDVQTAPLEQQVASADWSVWGLAFSPDGAELVSASWESLPSPATVARVWKVSDGSVIGRVTGPHETVVGLSPDGRNLIMTSGGHDARILDLPTGQLVRTLPGSDWIDGVTFSPDGSRIAAKRRPAGGNDTRWVEIWDASAGRRLFDLKAPNRAEDCIFSPDGSTLVTPGDPDLMVWDVQTGRQLYQMYSYRRFLHSGYHFVFSRDGTKFLVVRQAPDHAIVEIREARTGRVLHTLPESVGQWPLGLSPDGSKAMFDGDDGERIWDVATGNLSTVLQGHVGHIIPGSFSNSGSLALTAGEDSPARLWDVQTWRQLLVFAGRKDHVERALFSPDDSRVATVTEGRVWLWDAQTGSGYELK